MSDVIVAVPPIALQPAPPRRWMRRALFYYPIFAVMSVLSCGFIWALLTFWVPTFREIFRDFKTVLPAPTLYLLELSGWVREPLGFAVTLLVVLAVPLLPSMLVALPEERWKRVGSAVFATLMFMCAAAIAFLCIQIMLQLPLEKVIQSVSGGGS